MCGRTVRLVAIGESEIVGFQRSLKRRFSPSMRQRIDIGGLYIDAIDQLRAGSPDLQVPAENSFTLDDFLNGDLNSLLGRFYAVGH
jgi:hypothetical protein